MNFTEAEKYLTSLSKFGVKLGLERVQNYLDSAAYPWDRIKFIHVAGTNGKGSTAAMIANILQCAGYRAGLYSSPHIDNYCERIWVNGENISPQDFSNIVAEISLEMNIVSNEDRLTEFEFLTVLALEYFRREKVETAVIEVGMGGRFDATNVIPHPEISVITNVSMDHMDHLGSTVTEIAAEKAGIIKENGCLITAEPSDEIRSFFKHKCSEQKSDLHYVGEEIKTQQGEIEFLPEGLFQVCSLGSASFDLKNLRLRMLGQHQILNASTALLCAQLLLWKGFHISSRNISKGLESTSVPGRFEVLSHKPLVTIDAAHNVAGFSVLKETLAGFVEGRRLVLVTGVLDDKDQAKITEVWGAMPSVVVVTRPENPRSGSWEQLAHHFSRYLTQVCLIEDVQEAVAYGWSLLNDNSILCVAGSFYMLKRSRQQLQKMIQKSQLQ